MRRGIAKSSEYVAIKFMRRFLHFKKDLLVRKEIQDKEEHPVKKEKHEDQQEGCSTVAGEEKHCPNISSIVEFIFRYKITSKQNKFL